MNYLDSSTLVEYLRGTDAAHEYFEANRNTPFVTSSIVKFELYYGALKHPSPQQTIETVTTAIDWVRVVPFTEAVAREAAQIRNTLRKQGEQIGVPDLLIAGATREAGGTLITRDTDFQRIDGLDVHRF
jgi:tRNA(fMet)-specific endonuclease VapC